MTRDELEAVIWRNLSAYRTNSRITSEQFVDAILTAADAYMVAEGGLTAERRRQLAEATAPKRGPR
jgi:hypothetical protein